MMRSASAERDRLLAQRRRSRRRACACTMLPTKVLSCGRSGVKPGLLVAAPHDRRRRPLRSRRSCSGRSCACSRRSRARGCRPRASPARSRTAPRCRARRPRARRSRRPEFRSACRSAPSATTGSPGLSSTHRSDDPPISSTIVEMSPCSRSTHAPVSASPSIARRVPSALRRERLEVLQAVELARAGSAAPRAARAPRLRRSSA